MTKPHNNIESKLGLVDATSLDIKLYYQIKKRTCKKYVNKYFDRWNESKQQEYNNKIFAESLLQTCFKKICQNNKVIGFWGYTISKTEIGCVTLQIQKNKNRASIFCYLLRQLSVIADKLHLPIYAKTFLASKDITLYQTCGFEVMSKNQSHYLLKRTSKENLMNKEQYEEFAKNNFADSTKDLIIKQINNFYNITKFEQKHKKYKLNQDVILTKNHLMTGFKFDLEYLKLIAQEGKICGDFAGIETKHGIKWAVSTWKFAKTIKLKDYVTNYSGMTVVYNDNYEIVPYGKLDQFVEKLKKQEHFLWEAESTREMRFLPNDIRQNGNIALIFNVGHKSCLELLQNELQKDFGKRVAYILFGIPRNCIEGLFVNRQTEKNKKQLNSLKELFPDCYICNIDGKVIME